MAKIGRSLLTAFLAMLVSSACGSSQDGPPRLAPIDLACGDDLSGLEIAVAGETFLASFNREYPRDQPVVEGVRYSIVEGVRFTADGTVLDTPPLTISPPKRGSALSPARYEFRVTDLVGTESEFAVQFFDNLYYFVLGERVKQVMYRTVPTTGPLSSEAQSEISYVGLGEPCETWLGGRAAITYDLAGAKPRSAIQWGARSSSRCIFRSSVIEWIDGLPWESRDPLQISATSEGWPALVAF